MPDNTTDAITGVIENKVSNVVSEDSIKGAITDGAITNNDKLELNAGPISDDEYAEKVLDSSIYEEGTQKIVDTVKQHDKSKFKITEVKAKMNIFNNMVNKIKERFNNGFPVYTQYVYFSVNNTVLVNTSSTDWITNNLVSFTLEQNGSGMANKFTLEILFVQNDRNIQNIETLDAILLTATRISKDETHQQLKDNKDLFMDCEFIYGYGDDASMRSPKYSGKVMDYTPKLENGNLKYTITGYAGLISVSELKFSPKEEYITGPENNLDNAQKSDGTIIPFKYINNMFNVEFGEGSQYENMFKLEFLDNCFNDDTGGAFSGEDIAQFQQKNFFDVLADILNGCLSTKEQEILEVETDTSTSNEAITNEDSAEGTPENTNNSENNNENTTENTNNSENDNKNNNENNSENNNENSNENSNEGTTEDTNDLENNESTDASTTTVVEGQIFAPSQKQCYGYFIDSSNKSDATCGTVYIYKLPSLSNTSGTKNDDTNADYDLTFNWFAPSGTGANFLVKSWEPKIEGKVNIALAIAYQCMPVTKTYETMDDEGNIVKVNGLGSTRLGVTTKDNKPQKMTYNAIQEFSQWSKVMQYPNKANLVIQGCPCEIPLTGKIRINARMGTQLHSSSGVYFIMSKKDILNSSGYYTNLELFKVMPTYNPEKLTSDAGSIVVLAANAATSVSAQGAQATINEAIQNGDVINYKDNLTEADLQKGIEDGKVPADADPDDWIIVTNPDGTIVYVEKGTEEYQKIVNQKHNEGIRAKEAYNIFGVKVYKSGAANLNAVFDTVSWNEMVEAAKTYIAYSSKWARSGGVSKYDGLFDEPLNTKCFNSKSDKVQKQIALAIMFGRTTDITLNGTTYHLEFENQTVGLQRRADVLNHFLIESNPINMKTNIIGEVDKIDNTGGFMDAAYRVSNGKIIFLHMDNHAVLAKKDHEFARKLNPYKPLDHVDGF